MAMSIWICYTPELLQRYFSPELRDSGRGQAPLGRSYLRRWMLYKIDIIAKRRNQLKPLSFGPK